MASIPLAPITKTRFGRRITHGGAALTEHRECWGAETTDGAWEFEREDSPGTPWLIYHTATKTLVDQQGTLRLCRWYVAAGHAQTQLELLQAHDRGEHAAERVPQCRRC